MTKNKPIQDILKRIANPNKGIEYRIKRLETAVWLNIVAILLTQITIAIIISKW